MARIHDTSRFATPPDLADLEAYAREAFATVPAELRRHVGEVVIQVEDFPNDEVLEEMECESPFDLARPLRRRRHGAPQRGPTCPRTST